MQPETLPASVLDASQRRVLALEDGVSAAVFGAPGTGKTTTALELVADRVLGRGYAPEEVLVLSASRVAATALRDRLALRLGVPTVGPLARTANSVAFDLVRGREGESTMLLTGAEHDRLIAELLEGELDSGAGDRWAEPLTPDVRRLRGFRTQLRDLAMRAAEHAVTPAELAALGQRAGRPEWVAAAAFLDEYADVKDQARALRFDAAELAAYAAAIVGASRVDAEAAAALGSLARLRLVVVDDAQEQTAAAGRILAAFAQRGVAVIALGDPDVAANGFRGGRADLLGDLGAVLGLGDVPRLVLETVHRGRPELRALVAGVSAHIGTALGGLHRRAVMAAADDVRDDAVPADADPLAPVLGIEAVSSGVEIRRVAELLRERHLLDDVPWSRMAVVLRSGGDVPAFERGLALADVPTSAGTAARVALRDAPAAAALALVAEVAVGRRALDAEVAVRMLVGPVGRLDGVSLRRLRLALRQEELAAGGARTGDELLVEALSAAGRFATIRSQPANRAGRLAKVLADARAVATDGGTIEEILWAIWQGGGLAGEWSTQAEGTGLLAEEANRNLDAAVALFAAAERFVERSPESTPSRFLGELLEPDVPEDTLAPRAAADRVLVTTPAGLVGRDFDVVVLARMQEGVWPNLRPRGTLLHADRLPLVAAAVRSGAEPPAIETPAEVRAAVRSDELRLFALAASRATRQLVLTCVASEEEQPSKLMAYATERPAGRRRRPVQLRALVGVLRAEAAGAVPGADGSEAVAALALLAEQGVAGAHPEEWYGLLEPSTTAPLVDLDGDPGAVVAISPSQIERAEESPLGWFVDRVASPPSGVAASVGTIVHAVVEAAAAKNATSIDELWPEVESRFRALRFEAGWVAERELRGARRMAGGAAAYLADFADDERILLGAEGSFRLRVGRVELHGAIDRIETSPDGTTVIVDVKTGRTPPTATQVKTHAQLAAYQLAHREGALDELLEAGVAEAAERGDEVPQQILAGGAKLVYVAKPSRGTEFTVLTQQPFDDEAADGFRERLEHVGRLMAGSTFAGSTETGHGSLFSAWHYRVQVVPAVSA
ncbi:PD-(D/E)XK nuclease family protein [Agromyces seonyuensis]|uniref:DNA 3'-5' helicase n=1 Tax=Agromyces seonyuensis TaxID=2662446 RepID=A0A6I4P4Y6_9MICO|nr:PD-(D/E)XK nuclease family protein [Agromyces seonyuensis]MWC00026.1 AAA family ATPase [Agromyces seonyuensis]